jgi:hypothetical protein
MPNCTLSAPGDCDWYKVHAIDEMGFMEFSGENLNFKCTLTSPAGKDYDIQLFNSSGGLIMGSNSTSGPDNVNQQFSDAAGKNSSRYYYLRVYSKDSVMDAGPGGYTLTYMFDSF